MEGVFGYEGGGFCHFFTFFRVVGMGRGLERVEIKPEHEDLLTMCGMEISEMNLKSVSRADLGFVGKSGGLGMGKRKGSTPMQPVSPLMVMAAGAS